MSIVRTTVLLSVLIPGCVSPLQTADYVGLGKKAVDNNTRAIIGAARAQKGADQAVLDKYENAIEGRIAAQDTALSHIRKRIEDQEKAWKDFVLGVAQAAGSAIPGGGPIVGNLLTTLKNTKEDAASYTDAANSAAEDKFKQKLSAEADKRVSEIAAMEATVMAATNARLAKMSDETRQKLDSIDAAGVAELKQFIKNEEAFRKILQKKADLTDAQMETLKGFSVEELMAMLLAAAGATAAGGALGKTGKSRAQPQIDAINARLANSGNKTS